MDSRTTNAPAPGRSPIAGPDRRPIVLLSVALLLGLALFGLLALRRARSATPTQRLLATIDLHLDLPADTEVLHVRLVDERLASAELGLGNRRLRLHVQEGVGPEQVDAAVKEQWSHIHNLFQDHQAPYPGQLSHTLRCPEAFLPQRLETLGDALLGVRLYANERLAYGGCAEDLLSFSAVLSLHYDPDAQRLLRAEHFAPMELDSQVGEQLLGCLHLGAAASPCPAQR